MYNADYISNDSKTYDLVFGDIKQANLLLDENGANKITLAINDFMDEVFNESNGDVIEIKNDGDMLGVIVDVWDTEQTNLIDTRCFWFDDFNE